MSESTRTSAASPAAVPPRIAGYTFLSKLGQGGYSDVYLYEDEQLARKVAVKVLRLVDDAARRQFNNEMRVVSGFDDNPYIVPIFNPGRTLDDRPYFIMPFCPNGSLAARVRSAGPLPVADVVDTGVCIGRALAAVHAKRLLHRDVKPSNILVDGNGRPRLSDFGIAGAQSPSNSDERGDLAVSVAWSAPELLDGGYGSVASDLYSLGATLWHLLAGRSPYEIPGGDNSTGPAGAMERRIRAGRLPSMRRDGVPAALETLLRSMLAVEWTKRPADAETVVARLEVIARSPLGPAPVPDGSRRIHRASAYSTSYLIGADAASGLPEAGIEDWAADDQPLLGGLAPGRAGTDASKTGAPKSGALARRVLIPAAVIAVLAGALFGISSLLHHAPAAAPGPTAATTGLGPAPIDQDPGVPVEDEPPGPPTVTATRVDPATLRFTWVYSGSQLTDTFDWRSTDGAHSGASATPTIDVPDPAETQLCIEVRVVRADGSDAAVAWSAPGCGS